MHQFFHRNQNTPMDVVLPFDRTSRAVLPRPGDYVRVEKKNGKTVLSLPADIAHSGRTITTLLNYCSDPDFFGAVGAQGPAPARGGVDDALLVRCEREFVDVIYSLLGMKAMSCIFDISHLQWAELHESLKLQRSIGRSQLLVAGTIAEHINTVLAVDDLPCYKYGWSCGADANFDAAHEGLLGAGTLSVIEQIDAVPMGNLEYTRYGSGKVEDIISGHVFTKISGLLELPEFDDIDKKAEEFVIQQAREVARVRGVGAALAAEHGRRTIPSARAAETARRARDGSTAAQHDQNVNVAAPAMRAAEAARRRTHGITAAQHDQNVNVAAPAMRAAEAARRRTHGSTAAQHDHSVNGWLPAMRVGEVARRARVGATEAQLDQQRGIFQEAGTAAAQDHHAAIVAASGDPICLVAGGCRRKCVICPSGVPATHGKCKGHR